MENVLVIAVVVLIVGFTARYVYKEKKRGVKCIGCPDGCACGGNCGGCNGSCGAQ